MGNRHLLMPSEAWLAQLIEPARLDFQLVPSSSAAPFTQARKTWRPPEHLASMIHVFTTRNVSLAVISRAQRCYHASGCAPSCSCSPSTLAAANIVPSATVYTPPDFV